MATILMTMPFFVTRPSQFSVFRQPIARKNPNGAFESACFRRSFAKRIRITHRASWGKVCRPRRCLPKDAKLY